MSRRHIHATALTVTFVLGCGAPPPADVATQPSTVAGEAENGATAIAPAGDAQADFVAAFKRASENKDVEAMLKLYCLDGVDAEMRDVVRGNVQDEIRQPATEFTFAAPDPVKHGPRDEGGVRWKPNLPIVTVVHVKFAPAPPGSGFSVTEADYPLGMKSGQYKIALSVRE